MKKLKHQINGRVPLDELDADLENFEKLTKNRKQATIFGTSPKLLTKVSEKLKELKEKE